MTEENNPSEFPTLNQPAAWEEPILFDQLELPDMPAQYLPGALGSFAKALAIATETPDALSVMTILGVLSVILAQRVFISPREGWLEPINIYTLVALPPAHHKSLVLSNCTEPLIEWEQAQQASLAAEIKRMRSERKTQEKRIDMLRLRAAKAKSQLECLQLTEEIVNLEDAMASVPITPVLFITDATPESLTTTVQEQCGRLGVFSDEGGILETLAGLYSHGSANIDILLKGIDGGEVRVRRKDRCMALKPYLTVVLTVQPAILQRMAEKTAFSGNGTLERFLYACPRSQLGQRTHQTPPVPVQIKQAYHARITQLLNHFAQSENLSLYGNHKNKSILTLQPAAYAAWHDFQINLEKELGEGGRLIHCPGWGGKLAGFTLRIAGLLHLADQTQNSNIITEATLKNAIAMARILIEHALAAFELMGADPAVEDAKILFRWMLAQKQSRLRQSDITRGVRNRKWRTQRIQQALRVLQERHLISVPVPQLTRKPTLIYFINPKIRADDLSKE